MHETLNSESPPRLKHYRVTLTEHDLDLPGWFQDNNTRDQRVDWTFNSYNNGGGSRVRNNVLLSARVIAGTTTDVMCSLLTRAQGTWHLIFRFAIFSSHMLSSSTTQLPFRPLSRPYS